MTWRAMSARPYVLVARTRAEAAEVASGNVTQLGLAMTRLRRFKPPRPIACQPAAGAYNRPLFSST
jgi:hypothetical protein